jgi:cytoskeleton protein RodZ
MTDDSVQTANSTDRPECRDGVGVQLVSAREAVGWTTAEVAQRLRMSVKQIEAIESDRWHEFANTAILRAFVRSYAKLVNLNPHALTSSLPMNKQETAVMTYSPSVSVPLPGQGLSQKTIRLVLSVLLLILVIALIGSALWTYWYDSARWFHRPATADIVNQPVVPAPVPVKDARLPPEPSPATATADLVSNSAPDSSKAVLQSGDVSTAGVPALQLKFSEECWVEIFHDNNAALARGLQPAGSELSLQGKPPFRLLIGNAKAVDLRYQGKPVDLAAFTGDKVARLTLE